MKRKLLTLGLTAALAGVAACSGAGGGGRTESPRPEGAGRPAGANTQTAARAHKDGDAHAKPSDPHGFGGATAGVVPAFMTSPSALKSLAPTLAPEKFTGRRRAGYEAAQAIPETLAQLPCYCHCDRGFGHKSLHSCFVDSHAADCSICLDEALLAYKLQTEQKLKPEQIRERVIAQYGGR